MPIWKARTTPLRDGHAGTRDTLVAMQDIARKGARSPLVIQAAHECMRDVPERDERATIQALLQNVRDRMRYTPDPLEVELVKDPATVIANTGVNPIDGSRVREPMDCDDASVLMSSLLGAVGIASKFVAVAADGQRPDDYSHVYVRARLANGNWVGCDPIVRKWSVGQEVPKDRQYAAPMTQSGAIGGLGMHSADGMDGIDGMGVDASDVLNQVVKSGGDVAKAYVDQRYGKKPQQPQVPVLVPPTAPPQSALSLWLNPMTPSGTLNYKALAVWGVVLYAGYRLLIKKRRK